jgi:hypothetical protein
VSSTSARVGRSMAGSARVTCSKWRESTSIGDRWHANAAPVLDRLARHRRSSGVAFVISALGRPYSATRPRGAAVPPAENATALNPSPSSDGSCSTACRQIAVLLSDTGPWRLRYGFACHRADGAPPQQLRRRHARDDLLRNVGGGSICAAQNTEASHGATALLQRVEIYRGRDDL